MPVHLESPEGRGEHAEVVAWQKIEATGDPFEVEGARRCGGQLSTLTPPSRPLARRDLMPLSLSPRVFMSLWASGVGGNNGRQRQPPLSTPLHSQ